MPPPDIPNVGEEWIIWRIVSKGLATHAEIEGWEIDLILDANEFIDASEDIEAMGHAARREAAHRQNRRGDAMDVRQFAKKDGEIVSDDVNADAAQEILDALKADGALELVPLDDLDKLLAKAQAEAADDAGDSME